MIEDQMKLSKDKGSNTKNKESKVSKMKVNYSKE